LLPRVWRTFVRVIHDEHGVSMSLHPPVTREALYATFGADAFGLGCFYANQPALRFELSRDGHRLDQFAKAWDRARPIVDHAFGDSAELVVVLSSFDGGSPTRSPALFRPLRALGVRMGRPRAWWTEPHADEWVPEPETRLFVAFACGREALHRLLWGALAADLGIRPRLDGQLFVADPARRIIVHPYDDRGMDVVGPNRALLAELYHRFNRDLLDYGRARMDAFFASAAAGTSAG
jgi:hypothetical protein